MANIFERQSGLTLTKPSTWWFGFALWFGLLWFLSEQPASDVPGPEIPHFDKIAHCCYFAAGGLLLGTALAFPLGNRSIRPAVRFVATLLILTLIGALDEWHQTTTPGRDGGDLYDWIADVTGSVAGTIFSTFLHRYLTREPAPPDLAPRT